MDAKGYAERSNRKSFREQFRAILERYYFVAEKIQTVLNGLEGNLEPQGHQREMQGNCP